MSVIDRGERNLDPIEEDLLGEHIEYMIYAIDYANERLRQSIDSVATNSVINKIARKEGNHLIVIEVVVQIAIYEHPIVFDIDLLHAVPSNFIEQAFVTGENLVEDR